MRPAPAGTVVHRSVVTLALTSALLVALVSVAACSDYSPAPIAPIIPVDVPSSVDVVFCSGLAPAWVAVQDGDGAWTRVRPEITGAFTKFHHVFTTNRAGFATVSLASSGFSTLAIRYGAPGELATFGDTLAQHCSVDPSSRKLLGAVAGLDTSEVAFISAGPSSHRESAFPGIANEFELRDLTAGPQDLLATRARRTDESRSVSRMILRRGIELPDGATIPLLDFGAAESFEPDVRNVTLAGLGPEGVVLESDFSTTRSNHVIRFDFSSTATTRTYDAVPAARLAPGDLQRLAAATTNTGAGARSASLFFRAPVDLTLAFGALPSVPQLAVVATTPTLRLRARLDTQADYDRMTTMGYQQGANTIVAVSMTAAYASRTAGGYDLVVPELTGLDGFDPQWALHPGTAVLWSASRIGGTLPLQIGAAPHDGDLRRTASVGGTLQP